MTEPKTGEVNASQTFAQAITELTERHKASDQFLLVLDVDGERTFICNGRAAMVHKLAHEALDFVHSMDGDETKAGELKQAGRLN